MEEEMMMVMMKMKMNKMRSQEEPSSIISNTTDDHKPNHNIKIPIIATTTCPVWKLYENPFYIFQNQNPNQNQEQEQESTTDKQIHRLHLPIPARKIAASFWDLTFIKPFMESDLESARAQITEARAELESECKARKKLESLNKRLAKEVSEERRGREALERVCEELAMEITAHKSEISRMRREIEDERKMLRTAETIREERVQMKLSEAKILMEEKLTEMETTSSKKAKQNQERSCFLGEKLRLVLGEKVSGGCVNEGEEGARIPMALMKRKSGGETENPHIRRGIKGFVEFPKVVRAIGCRSSKHLGKLECQKAQLKILLKQKGAVRFNGLLAR